MQTISDFTESEIWIINSTLVEHYGEVREIQLAETELRLDMNSTEMVPCPTAYWDDIGCILKLIN